MSQNYKWLIRLKLLQDPNQYKCVLDLHLVVKHQREELRKPEGKDKILIQLNCKSFQQWYWKSEMRNTVSRCWDKTWRFHIYLNLHSGKRAKKHFRKRERRLLYQRVFSEGRCFLVRTVSEVQGGVNEQTHIVKCWRCCGWMWPWSLCAGNLMPAAVVSKRQDL